MIDWQFVVRGPGAWDVGAFCMMSLPVEQRRAWERELGLIYLSELEGERVTAWPGWFEEGYGRVALSFAAHMITNAPMFDFDDPNVVSIVRELFLRAWDDYFKDANKDIGRLYALSPTTAVAHDGSGRHSP